VREQGIPSRMWVSCAVVVGRRLGASDVGTVGTGRAILQPACDPGLVTTGRASGKSASPIGNQDGPDIQSRAERV